MFINEILDWARTKRYWPMYGSALQVNDFMTDADYSACKNGIAVYCHLITSMETVNWHDRADVAVYFAKLCDFDFNPTALLTVHEQLKDAGKAMMHDFMNGNTVKVIGEARWQFGYDDYAENVAWACMRVTIEDAAGDCFPFEKPVLSHDWFAFGMQEGAGDVSFVSRNTVFLPDLEYSFDGIFFKKWNVHHIQGGSSVYETIHLTADKYLYIRGNNPNGLSVNINGSWKNSSFTLSNGDFYVFGDLTTLLSHSGDKDSIPEHAFERLLASSIHLISAAFLRIPAVSIGDSAMKYMFNGCRFLNGLPMFANSVKELGNSALYGAFMNCIANVNPPIINVGGIIGENAMSYMLSGDTALSAPMVFTEAVEYQEDCYLNIFQDTNMVMSDDGEHFNFVVPWTYPWEVGNKTFLEDSRVAEWMGNDRGFDRI